MLCTPLTVYVASQLPILGFLDTKFDTVVIEFGTSVNELDRPPCSELHESNDCLKRLAIHRRPAIPF